MQKITPHNIDNVYQELMSKNILAGIFPEKYTNLGKSESPDFICSEKKIGVEITNAVVGERRAQWKYMMSTYYNRDSLTKRDYKNMKKHSYNLADFFDGGLVPIGSYWGDEVNLIGAYSKKLNLIENENITFYNSLELFINATFMEEYNLTNFLLYLQKEKITNRILNYFDIIFIRTEGRLIKIEYQNLAVQEFKIGSEFFKECKNAAIDEIEAKSDIKIKRKY